MQVIPDCIELEQIKYLQQKQQYKQNENEFQEVKNYMMTSQIQCFKYNNSIDKQVQKETCFDAFISLSSDGKELVITNRRYDTDNSSESDSEEGSNSR